MEGRKKFIPHLLFSIVSIIGIFVFINIFAPLTNFDFKYFKLSPIIPFFGFLFLSFAGLFIFALNNIRRGILIGILISSFFLIQYLHINNLIYSGILVVIITLIELFFWKKKV